MSETEESSGRLATAVYLGFLVWILYMLVEVSSWTRFEDWVLPTLFGAPLVAATVLKLLTIKYPGIVDAVTPEQRSSMDEFKEDIKGAGEVGDVRSRSEQLRSGLIMSVWIAVLVAGLYLIGYWITLPVFTFAFTWYLKRNLRLATVLTVVFSIAAYVIFVGILDAFIWEGIVF